MEPSIPAATPAHIPAPGSSLHASPIAHLRSQPPHHPDPCARDLAFDPHAAGRFDAIPPKPRHVPTEIPPFLRTKFHYLTVPMTMGLVLLLMVSAFCLLYLCVRRWSSKEKFRKWTSYTENTFLNGFNASSGFDTTFENGNTSSPGGTEDSWKQEYGLENVKVEPRLPKKIISEGLKLDPMVRPSSVW
eukprot:CAMPEP_0114522800 /NCGR_PEP_ID=MMETSP0109-20121206/20939_1 /TAXON_ID=29199 /ORGANISM="Chlorarachnion reptans, Strain CCCM449" /LENGTH=187 /DNA_ID=CAMNT_0001704049 /DNA_START=116 /DNA_END=676 /DNA_ORIENTATION=-